MIARLTQGSAKAQDTAQRINLEGGAAIAVAGDITNNAAIDEIVRKAVELGGGKIHIIINNAGYAWDDPIEKIRDEQWGEISAKSMKLVSQANEERNHHRLAQHRPVQAHSRCSTIFHG